MSVSSGQTLGWSWTIFLVTFAQVLRPVRLVGAMLQDGMQFLALLESLSMEPTQAKLAHPSSECRYGSTRCFRAARFYVAAGVLDWIGPSHKAVSSRQSFWLWTFREPLAQTWRVLWRPDVRF